MAGDTKKAFWEEKNTAFGSAAPGLDLLHPEFREREPSPELTETQYLGFNIPEQNIHGLCYLWHHPNLGVVTGGAWAWRGVKRHTLQCEIFDMLTYVDDAVLANDLHEVTLPNGYRTSVLEPLKRLRIGYADADRGNAIDIEFEAMMDPMVLSSEMHFEQGMRTRGSVTFGGHEYPVDGYTVRDRSWGQVRREAHANVPPMAWMTCVFDDDLAFGTTAFDAEETNPDWRGVMKVPGGDPTRGGWVLRGGELVPVVSTVKRTIRNATTRFPEAVELTITDATGQRLEALGTILAAANWRTWHNMDSIICLTRWECDGRIGHGDFQDVWFHDYVRQFLG
ncbi:MAG TPA: hypothetical protein VGH89_14185 [Pseudonocardia sp.]|jgi:hypothetical protein